MKVLIADKFEKSGLDGLKAAGCDVIFQPDASGDSLIAAIKESRAPVLVVRSTKVTEPMLDAGVLSLIVRAGAGVNTIDVAGASKRGIYVSNCPGKNSVAVAELTMGLILSVDRRIPDNVAELRAGKWNKKEFSKAQGPIGANARPDWLWPHRTGSRRPGARLRHAGAGVEPPLQRGCGGTGGSRAGTSASRWQPRRPIWWRSADILSVHLALTKETRGFVNADLLAHARKGAYFINTARGEVVDYAALEEAVKTKGLRVGLDVFANEPAEATADFADPLVAQPNVYGTHHIGASTDQAQEAIAAETVRIIRTFKDTGKVPNVVNLAKLTPATHMLVVRHRDKPGVLAHVFEYLRVAHLNVQETENIIFDGAQAAVARINLDGAPVGRARSMPCSQATPTSSIFNSSNSSYGQWASNESHL